MKPSYKRECDEIIDRISWARTVTLELGENNLPAYSKDYPDELKVKKTEGYSLSIYEDGVWIATVAKDEKHYWLAVHADLLPLDITETAEEFIGNLQDLLKTKICGNLPTPDSYNKVVKGL